jgi:hypothetical protein
MKKWSLILWFAAIVGAAFIFTACDEDDSDKSDAFTDVTGNFILRGEILTGFTAADTFGLSFLPVMVCLSFYWEHARKYRDSQAAGLAQKGGRLIRGHPFEKETFAKKAKNGILLVFLGFLRYNVSSDRASPGSAFSWKRGAEPGLFKKRLHSTPKPGVSSRTARFLSSLFAAGS